MQPHTPTTEPPITSSIDQEWCWICHRKFIECGGTDPSVIRNYHHIVPQANGGTDGPTVTLCSAHHDLLHAIATQILAQKPYENLLGGIVWQERRRVLYLASVVVRSTLAVANDPNKRAQVALVMTGVQRAKLGRLAEADKRSLSSQILHLIEAEYARRYPTIK